MKPIQIGFLVAAGVLGGALFTKWQIQKQPPAPASVPVVSTPPAPLPETLTPPSQPAAEPPPSPFLAENKKTQPKPATEGRRRSLPARSSKPERETTVAQNQPPSTPAPAPAVVPEKQVPSPGPELSSRAEQQIIAPTPVIPPPPRKVTIAAGTLLPVRLVESLSTERTQAGDSFSATLAEPLTVDGFVIAERGARLQGRVVESERAGRVKGVSSMSLELTQLRTSDGQRLEIQTDSFEKQGLKSVGKDAAKIGAAAGIGAAIGAIAGGGKGAGIGAAIGGAAGTGGVMATRGDPVVLPSETKISFRLRKSVTITERAGRTER